MVPKQAQPRPNRSSRDPQGIQPSELIQGPDVRLAAYNAIVDYHNGLAYIRFTIAGLHLAASGFLISSWFEPRDTTQLPWAIPVMGFVITLICIALEMRTAHLLDNLDERGLQLEGDLGISAKHGFFALMHCQPKGMKFPLLGKQLADRDCDQSPKPDPFSISHTSALYALYFVILGFWLLVLAIAILPFLFPIFPGPWRCPMSR